MTWEITGIKDRVVYPVTTLQMKEIVALAEGLSEAFSKFEAIADEEGADWGEGINIRIPNTRIPIETDASGSNELLGWLMPNDVGGWDFTQKEAAE